jgi:hypothetical protein
MRWLKWLLSFFFDCIHRHTTWPHRNSAGFDYVRCLDCGRELAYSLERMSIVTREEQLEDRGLATWKEPISVKRERIAGRKLAKILVMPKKDAESGVSARA